MGTWGAGAFQNDTALDWVGGLVDSGGAASIHTSLSAAARPGFLDCDACCEALAAAEIVAASLGRPSPSLPHEIPDWLKRVGFTADEPTRELAIKALAGVSGASELRQLWEEWHSVAKWDAALSELTSRLQSS